VHQEGGFVVCFPLNVLMVHSPKPTIITNSNRQTDVGFTLGETIHFGSLEFITDRFSSLSLPLEGSDSGGIFVGMVHSRSSSLHAILAEGEARLPHLLRMQCGDPDCPHHSHITTRRHSSTTDHPDGPTVDHRTTARHLAPS
jgi:hypothetical protein